MTMPTSMPHNFGANQGQAYRRIIQEYSNPSSQDFYPRERFRREEFQQGDFPFSKTYHREKMGFDQHSTAETISTTDKHMASHGDLPVVQPSFDDHEASGKKSSPTNAREGHRRNLSEHFQDATSLSNDKSSDAGHKHRREYSGDVSNPALAHRRIDSIGNSTSIQRGKPHRRIDSSGLDALTAAADFSREELEAASAGRHSWNKHPNLRRSPIETPPSYEHSGHGSSPPSHPPHPHLVHHRHFSSSALPGRPVYYNHSLYPQPPYPHTYHYNHHPGASPYGRHHGAHHPPPPPPPPGGYPIQYARPPHGQEHFVKHPAPLQKPMLETEGPPNRSSPTVASIDHKQALVKPTETMPPPSHWPRGGSTQGVQTYITGIGVGETTGTIAPGPKSSPAASGSHHRKLSSFSNLGSFLFGGSSHADPVASGGKHHRKTSSAISFLGALDVNERDSADAAFLRNLQESTGTAAAAYDSSALHVNEDSVSTKQSSSVALSSKIHPGGTSKRVRRKCTIEGCQNRVVQGGLCISHGAKRKLCKYPGCKKHVKKAGLCSTHGPARKRCEVEGCVKVAVQGGRCIAHGAKKKLCSVDQCTKQAILGGMCKKHHDQNQAVENTTCTIIESKKSYPSKDAKKPGHTRGLSIFQEISADAVGDLLSPESNKGVGKPQSDGSDPTRSDSDSRRKLHRHRSTASQLLVDIV